MELYAYIHQTPPPEDADVTSESLAYLEACNKLFERGFLTYLQQWFRDFEEYKSRLLLFFKLANFYFAERFVINMVCIEIIGLDFQHTSSTQKSFLSWQSL